MKAEQNSSEPQTTEIKQEGTAPEQVLSNEPAAPIATRKEDGLTSCGKRFSVPETYDCVEVLTNVKKWTEIPVLFNVFLVILFFFSYLYRLPNYAYMFFYIFWRLGYNVGIGYILYQQSNHHTFSKLYEKLISNPTFKRFVENNFSSKEDIERVYGKHGSVKKADKLFEVEKYPTDFGAWMLFRSVVDIILVNDFVCYLVFCIAYFEVPQSLDMYVLGRVIIGGLLISFNVWAKLDAHRVLGDYAWYWGDFFFLLDKDLTFDGIFQMFPHPMYTVGYSFYYGLSVITGSYTVLAVSFMAHMLQLTFLVFVENPHIDKTYGASVGQTDPDRDKVLSEYFDKKEELIIIKNLDIFKASDALLVIIILYTVVLAFANLSPWFYVAQVIVWRLFHTVGLGYILREQSKSKWWTNHWEKLGKTKKEAFDSWKKLFNASLTLNHLVFVICFIKLLIIPSDWGWSSYFAKNMVGVVLIGLNIWGSISTYEVLGDFGWFYGDFFIDEIPGKLFYHGVYRYVNNPDIVLGFAAYYGLSLICHNPVLFALALLSQISSYYFDKYVEKPHMERKYGNELRSQGGIAQVITIKLKTNKTVQRLTKRVEKMKVLLEELQQNPQNITKEIKELIEKFNSNFQKTDDKNQRPASPVARRVLLE